MIIHRVHFDVIILHESNNELKLIIYQQYMCIDKNVKDRSTKCIYFL